MVMPKVNAWDVDEYNAHYRFRLVTFLTPIAGIDNTRYFAIYQGDAIVDEDDQNRRDEITRNILQYNPETSRILFPNGKEDVLDAVIGVPAANAVNRAQSRCRSEFIKESKNRSDPRTKRFYQDLAYLADTTKGNYVQMDVTSPYMSGLIATMISLVNPHGLSSKEQKAGLGLSLYEDVYDFDHAVINEVKAEYHKQQFQKAGQWSEENKRIYRKELWAAHRNILNCYSKLKEHVDDPQKVNTFYLGNTLVEVFGRAPESHREVNTHIGFVRGETQALENGWDIDQLSILGAIGGIEEAIRKYEQYGNEAVKNSIKELKADFLKLKNDCYYTYMDNSTQKELVARQVVAFIEKHTGPNETAAEHYCLLEVKNYKQSILDALKSCVAAKNVEDNTKSNSLKKKTEDPVAYIRGLLEEADRTGAYREVVLECLHLKERAAEEYVFTSDKVNAIEQVAGELFNPNRLNAKVIAREALNIKTEKMIEASAMAEQLAEEIREGRYPVAEEYEAMKTDYMFSKRYANQILVDAPVNKCIQAARDAVVQYQMSRDDYYYEQDDYFKAIKASKDPYSISERKLFDAESNKLSTGYPKNFPDEQYKLVEMFRDEIKDLTRYKELLSKDKQTAHNLFNELDTLAAAKPIVFCIGNNRFVDGNNHAADPKKSNSRAFMDMYNALKDIDEMTDAKSPKDILDAYYRLDNMAAAYDFKITNQKFAAKSKNGARRHRLSKEIRRFAKAKIAELSNLPEGVAVNISLENQTESIKKVRSSLKKVFDSKVQEKIDNTIENVKQNLLKPYDEKLDFAANKAGLEKALGHFVICHNIEKALNSKPGQLFSEVDLNDESLSSKMIELKNNNPAFKGMIDAVKSPEDYIKLHNIAEKNPKQLIAEMSKHVPKVEEKVHNDNNIIKIEGPGIHK